MDLKSAPVTILLGSVGLILLGALGWVALIGPAVGELGTTGTTRTETQDRNHAMRLELARLRKAADDLESTDALAGRLDEMYPATADQPGFFAQLSDVTEGAGVKPSQVTVLSPGVPTVPPPAGAPQDAPAPDPAVTPGVVAEQVVEVAVQADYATLAEVLEGIENMPRAFLVDTVTLASDGDDEGKGAPQLTLTVTGRTFVAPQLRPTAS